MQEQRIHNGREIIGFIVEQDNGDKTIKDGHGQLLGRYCKSSNITRDSRTGAMVSYGEAGLMLLLRK